MTNKQFNILAWSYMVIATIITAFILCSFASEIADYIFNNYSNTPIELFGWFFETINQYIN